MAPKDADEGEDWGEGIATAEPRVRPARSAFSSHDHPSQPASAVADTLQSAVERSLREQPMSTLGVVVALSFVLGALWRS